MDQQFYLDEKIIREGDGSFLTYGRRQLQNIETFFKKNINACIFVVPIKR